MSTAVATRSDKPIALRDQLVRMAPEFAKALPGHITADKFVRTAQTAIALTRNIGRVKDPQSLLAACTKAASDGLILDGREAALVVDYQGDVQYRPMMRGLLKLAYNSGQLKSLVVELVRENDYFDYEPTNAEKPITHKIDLRQPRGDAYAVYAIATLADGGVLHEVMSAEDVNKIRNRSDAWKAFVAKKIKSTPWHTDWSEMARKTVFRRLSKYLPSSAERDRLADAAERVDGDYIEIDATPIDTSPKGRQAKKRGGAAATLAKPAPALEPEDIPQDSPPDDFDQDTGEIYDDMDQRPDDDI